MEAARSARAAGPTITISIAIGSPLTAGQLVMPFHASHNRVLVGARFNSISFRFREEESSQIGGIGIA